MNQSVVMVVDPQPELLRAIQQDLQQTHQKLRILYANSPIETLKKLKDLQSYSDSLALLIVEQKFPRRADVDLLQLVRGMFPKVRRFMLKAYDSDELPSYMPIPTAFVVCTHESTTALPQETVLPDLRLLTNKS